MAYSINLSDEPPRKRSVLSSLQYVLKRSAVYSTILKDRKKPSNPLSGQNATNIKRGKNALVQLSMHLVKERGSRVPTAGLSSSKRTQTRNMNHPFFNNSLWSQARSLSLISLKDFSGWSYMPSRNRRMFCGFMDPQEWENQLSLKPLRRSALK